MLFNNGEITAVFSHPNHEVAIFCLLERIRPQVVYLTDGGGEKRLNQTRHGLESIGLLDRAHFLNYTEKSFYDALLNSDLQFYKKVSMQVAKTLHVTNSRHVLCDAVEFYNPVHDMSLPIVKAAVGKSSEIDVFEVPLVYQKPGQEESYELQQMSPSRRRDQVELHLSDQERIVKTSAWQQIYTILGDQMGSIVSQLPGVEVIAPACSSLPQPGDEQVLRYEWRAQRLMESGEIQTKITYTNHYLPIATTLMNGYH